MHGQEIGRIFEPRDQREFIVEGLRNVWRDAVGISSARAFPRKGLQRFLRRGIALAQFLGIIVREFVEAEGQAVEKADRFLQRFRRLAKQPRHFAGVFQMTLRIGVEQPPGIVDSSRLRECRRRHRRARAVREHA